MSNDLISRKALIDAIEKWLPKDPCGQEQSIEEEVATDLSISMLMEIEEAPTAYDVDAVCEEIKDCGTETCASVSCNKECSDCDHGSLIKTIVEIVRNGGKKK